MNMFGRTAAAQFFQDDEEDDYSRGISSRSGGSRQTGTSSSPGVSSGLSSRTRQQESYEPNDYKDEAEVAELLTKAAVTNSDKLKLDYLKKVKEIIINKQPALLDNFLDEMLNFQTDNDPDIRIYILEFISDACKADHEIIPKVLDALPIILNDIKVSVQKKAIQVIGKIYAFNLMWLCRAKTVTQEMESSWSAVNDLKRTIIQLIDNDNDAIRTHTVKFIETVILLQTPNESDSIKRENDFCLDDVPITVKVARPRKLEEDAKNLFEVLLKFHGSRHATSVNLMTVMGSIVLIAKFRPHFMGKVIAAMEKLNAILPPTLERSQVTSVRKHMKVQLIGLLRHPRGIDFYDNITTLLTDLGATNQELHKFIHNWDEIRSERRKRQRAKAEKEESSNRKRARLALESKPINNIVEVEEDYDDDDEEMEKPEVEDSKSVFDEHEKNILEKLTPENTVDLVITSMDNLPDTLPAHFMSSYTPIAIAGTENQIRHVARLLAAQITAHQKGPSEALIGKRHVEDLAMESVAGDAIKIPTLVSNTGINTANFLELKKSLLMPPAPQMKKKMINKKLSEVTKPLLYESQVKHLNRALKRILTTSDEYLIDIKCKLISNIGASSNINLRSYLMQYISEDIKNRLDFGIHWIYSEYNLSQGFVSKPDFSKNDENENKYELIFCTMMKSIMNNALENERSGLTWRLYTETPSIPDKGLELLKEFCSDPAQANKGMALLMEFATKRPMPKKLYYLNVLLDFCSHSNEKIRNNGVSCILQLYEDGEERVKRIIEDQALNTYLNSLRLPKPPEILFSESLGRKDCVNEWNEELVKACLHLYFQILTLKNSLIHELAKVYVETAADVKRGILRYIEPPIRKMGMDSTELMKLLDSFPKGAETLITRIIHILTDVKTLPSADLVARVRNLYAKRVSDVRFLIPVLNGLTKVEIISALPKLIKLNPNVVKEVFNRLLGIHADGKISSPITPVDLMVALHNIEPSKCEIKTVIKATSLCFNEVDVYTAEVLAIVINQLLDQNPLPTLLMRTVIQTLALHSKLSGFIMNTLGRLVGKQVWNQPKVWEGFIKCVQRTIPKSIPILLTLPPAQLSQALDEAPDLREPLSLHLMSFSQQQRSCMPPILLNIIFKEEHVKNENYEGDSGRDRNNIKDEPLEPRDDMVIKDEPIEFNN